MNIFEDYFYKSIAFRNDAITGLKLIEKAISLNPSHLYYYRKAKFERKLKRNSEALNSIEKAIDLFSKEEIKNWVNYNLAFAEIVNLKKKSNKVYIFSIILGLFIGCFYVLISKAINQRNIKNI